MNMTAGIFELVILPHQLCTGWNLIISLHVKEHHGRLAVGSELYRSRGRCNCCGKLTLDRESVLQSCLGRSKLSLTHTKTRARRLSVSFQPVFAFQSP
jgi:hypothetical protein